MATWQLVSTANGETSAESVETRSEAMELYQATMFSPIHTHAEIWEVREGAGAVCISFWDESTQTYGGLH